MKHVHTDSPLHTLFIWKHCVGISRKLMIPCYFFLWIMIKDSFSFSSVYFLSSLLIFIFIFIFLEGRLKFTIYVPWIFFFFSSFGKRSAGSFRRGCECIVLEPSEMIVVRMLLWRLFSPLKKVMKLKAFSWTTSNSVLHIL